MADVLEPAVHQSIVVVDVEGFGARHRTRADQGAIRHGLYQALQLAFSRSRVGWDDCYHEDRGDGVLILVPPHVPKAVLAAGVPGELAAAVHAHNEVHDPNARMRLRLALHGGEVAHDAYGVTGTAVNVAFRLLEAGQLKQALAGSPGVLAVIASAWFYEEVIRHTEACAPATWRRVLVAVKETREDGWISLPDAPYPAYPDTALPPVPPTAAEGGPRQLPPDTALFTGRGRELGQLLAFAQHAASQDASGTVVISAIAGMGGIGKTALAIHAAHLLADHFPDGQLFLDLHGFTPDTPRRDPSDALAVLLRALGFAPARIPLDLDARAALYRDRLADTRTLILLDNAADEAQIRPLLPAASTCLVLVTSRQHMTAIDDALPLPLDVLPLEEAVALLGRTARLRSDRGDQPLLEQIAALCGRLPLALAIAGALLRTGGQAWNLKRLASHLRAERPGRNLAAFDDGSRELAAVFDVSYRALTPDRRRLYHHLGLLPGSEIDAYAAAALLDTDPEVADRLLERLADHSLLTGAATGRYRPHDLIRAHARALAVTLEPELERESALGRLLHYYAHTAQNASQPIARYPRPAPEGPSPDHAPALPDADAARTWLRTEQPNLVAAFTYAHTHGLDGHAIALAAGLAETLQTDGPWTVALDIHQTAADTAEHLGHTAAHATALNDLGRVRYLTGDYLGAGDAHTQALELFRALGHRLGEATALTELGRVWYIAADFSRAGDALARALELFRALGHRLGEATALTDLGRVQQLTGDMPGAGDALARALEIYRALGHRLGEATTLTEQGRMRYQTGDFPGADDIHTSALEIYRQIGNHLGEANALLDLARVRYQTGDFPGAGDALTGALQIYRQIGHRHGEANALTDLGRVRSLTGDYLGAGDALTGALQIYRALGHRNGEAYVLTNLGRVRYQAGDYLGAVETLTRALKICRALGDRVNEAWALNHYAAALAASGERLRALALYQQALAMNRELNKPDDEALSLEGIADHNLATGDLDQGVTHLRQALEIYQRLGMRADIERVQARLAGLPSH